MNDTPVTDAAEEADSHAFQILYPHMKYRGVKGDRMRALERENRKMREALEFYADAANWQYKETGIGCYPGDAIDYGAKARAALG